ncbi:MAG: FKBP-type peptidyl-prolyl cis-trans isomerase [Bacillota bacterium]
MKIRKHTVATIEYTVTDEQGQVLDTSRGRGPWAYLHGVGGIIPGMEQALEGKDTGESIKVTLPPEKAYGPKNPELIQAIPRKNFSGVDSIQVGMKFRAQTEAGARIVTVTDVNDQTVTVDANHPLAGATLMIEATVLDVREATEEEINHTHVCHGDGNCGGCQ